MFPRDIESSDIRRDQPRDGEFHFRLAFLWQDSDHWWKLVPQDQVIARLDRIAGATIAHDISGALRATEEPPLEEALANVQPMVDDAIQKIIDYAIPYFATINESMSKDGASL